MTSPVPPLGGVGCAAPVEHGGDLATRVERWADRRPAALAIAFEGADHSYRAFFEQVAATAGWLASVGISEGDRVAWLGPNRPAALRLILACSWLGAIYLPLNARLAPPEHRWILNHAGASLLATDTGFAEHAAHINAHCDLHVAPDEPDCFSASGAAPLRRGSPSHPVLLAYTSGTTGHPKGALLDQAALSANAVNSTHAHDLWSGDRVLTAIPLFHVGGLNIQTLPALFTGAAVRLHRTFDAGLFLDDVEEWQPTWTVLVPAALAAVSSHPRFGTADLSSLRGIMTGSSPVPEAVTAPYFDRGLAVGQIYGATETAPIAVHLRCDEAATHRGSCGKPSTMCDVRIVNDEGEVVAAGERGELWVRGPSVLREYWNDPHATAEALTEGWFRTGDIGHTDSEGWIFIDDRRTDMIISGGENIYPAELEEVLSASSLVAETVAEATVVGVPHERWGEVPVIVAVRLPDAAAAPDLASDDTTARCLLGLFDGRLARFKHPHEVIWLDELPRTALGKVRKHEVKKLLAQQETQQETQRERSQERPDEP